MSLASLRLALAALLVAAGCSGPRAAPPAGSPRAAPQAPPTPEERDEPAPAFRTRLVLLGTGTPNADPERSGPAVAVVVDDVAYLVDAGPGVVRRAVATGLPALAAERLGRVFITHLHSDHTAGLPDLWLTPWVLGRETPLELFGPPGLRSMADHLAQAWAADLRVRLDGLEPANDGGWRMSVHEITEAGEVYADDLVRVRAIEVPHGSWPHAFGFRVDGPDRSIVISGDTAPSDALVDACDGCDVLLHESFSAAAFAAREPEWQAYHRAFHTSAVDVGRLAARARAGRVVLYHHLLWGASPEDLVEEVHDGGYDGPVAFGEDLDVY